MANQPPPPIKPADEKTGAGLHPVQTETSLFGNASNTSNAGSAEKFEIEESSEFLQPIDDQNRVMVDDEDDYQTLENIKTVLHPPNTQNFITYNKVPWTLKIRKEVFSPSETAQSPLAVNLIFCQV